MEGPQGTRKAGMDWMVFLPRRTVGRTIKNNLPPEDLPWESSAVDATLVSRGADSMTLWSGMRCGAPDRSTRTYPSKSGHGPIRCAVYHDGRAATFCQS
jgi:hypothetical protein